MWAIDFIETFGSKRNKIYKISPENILLRDIIKLYPIGTVCNYLGNEVVVTNHERHYPGPIIYFQWFDTFKHLNHGSIPYRNINLLKIVSNKP